MRCPAFAAILCVVAAAPVSAQSPYSCFQPDLTIGPEPVTLPQPLAPVDPPGRPTPGRESDGRLTRPVWTRATPGTPPVVGIAYLGERGCPTLSREQGWTGTRWSARENQTVATYSGAGYPLTIGERHGNGIDFTYEYLQTYSYDASGHLVELVVEQDVNGMGHLQLANRVQTTNDASGRVLSSVYEQRAGDAWQPVYRQTYAYAGGPFATAYLREEAVGDGWEPSYRGTFTYTAAGLREVLVYETWTGTQCTLASRETWLYDADQAASVTTEFPGNMTTERVRTLFGYAGPLLTSTLYQRDTGNGWRDGTLKTFTYDENNRLSSYIYAVAQGDGIPLNLSRTLYIYDGAELFETQNQGWNGSTWFTDGRERYSRLPDGNVAERVSQRLEGAEWVNRSRLRFGYDSTTDGETSPEALVLDLRTPKPNPTAGRTTLAFTLGDAGPARLAVVDALGREIAVLVDGRAEAGETTVVWDAAGLPAGVYVTRLAAGGRVQSQRVTVVR